MITKTLAAALAAALLTSPMVASAQERDTRSTAVSYADLDLTTQHGRKQLESRIDHAARKVCGMDEHATGSNMASRDSRECYRQAKQQLHRQFASVVESATRGG